MRKIFLGFILVLIACSTAQALVPNETTHNIYTGSGSSTSFPYTFKIFAPTDIKVVVNDVLKTLNVDYTVTGVGSDAGGNIVFTTAPILNSTVSLSRNVPFTQTTDYIPNQPFNANTIETNFDKLTMQTLQLKDQQLRTPAVPTTSGLTNLVFPPPGASLYLKWNDAGTALELGPGGSPGPSGLANLNNLTAATQSFGNDINVIVTSTGAVHQFGWSGVLSVARGGLGVGTITGLVKGNGTSAVSAFAGSACASGKTATSIDASGVLTCADTVSPSGTLTANRLLVGGDNFVASPLGSLGTTTTVLHGNASGAPSFGAVSLTTDVSGTLPVAAGGTGATTITGLVIASGTAPMQAYTGAACGGGDVVVGITSSGTVTCTTIGVGNVVTSGTLTANQLILGNATTSVVALGSLGTTTTVLHGNAGGAPSFAAVSLTADVSGTLPVASGGTGVGTITGLVKGNGTSAFTAYAGSSCGGSDFVKSLDAAGAVTCGTPAGAGNVSAGGTLTSNQITLGAGSTSVATLGSLGTTTTVLHGNAGGAPSFAAVSLTADVSGTLPVASGGTGVATITGLVVGNGASAMSAYAGGTCSVGSSVTAISATGALTCAPFGGITGAGSAGQMTFWSSGSAIAGDGNLVWDSTNHILFITGLSGSSGYNLLLTNQDTENGIVLDSFSTSTSTNQSHLFLTKARGTKASKAVVQTNDNIGEINWSGYNGSSYFQSASIISYVDGAIDPYVAGRLTFNTTPHGQNFPTTRMTILSDGKILVPNAGQLFMGEPTTSAYNPAVTQLQFKTWLQAASTSKAYLGVGVQIHAPGDTWEQDLPSANERVAIGGAVYSNISDRDSPHIAGDFSYVITDVFDTFSGDPFLNYTVGVNVYNAVGDPGSGNWWKGGTGIALRPGGSSTHYRNGAGIAFDGDPSFTVAAWYRGIFFKQGSLVQGQDGGYGIECDRCTESRFMLIRPIFDHASNSMIEQLNAAGARQWAVLARGGFLAQPVALGGYSFVGDETTGYTSTATQQLNLRTGGTDRLIITTDVRIPGLGGGGNASACFDSTGRLYRGPC